MSSLDRQAAASFAAITRWARTDEHPDDLTLNTPAQTLRRALDSAHRSGTLAEIAEVTKAARTLRSIGALSWPTMPATIDHPLSAPR